MKPMRHSTRLTTWRPALLLAAAAVIVYLPAIRAGFVWDDDLHVTANATLTAGLRGLYDIWFGLFRFTTCQFYPLTFTGFWLQSQLWGLNPAGYHLVNILMHAVNTLLFWRLLRRLLPASPAPALAAALFAVHPVNVMSVAWITELKNGLAGCFMLLTALVFLRTEASATPSLQRHLGPFSLFVCAMLAKTAAVVLLPGLLLIQWWRDPGSLKPAALRLVPYFLFAASLTAVTIHVEQGRVWGADPRPVLSLLERSLIAGRAFWAYVGHLVWPVNLTFLYPPWTVDARNPWSYGPLAACLLVLATFWGLRPRLGRGPAAALLYFFIAAPALVLAQTMYMMRYTPIADHWQYFASPALFMLAACGLVRATARLPRPLSVGAGLALLLLLAGLTWRQCRMYQDEETLWQETVRRNPQAWLAHNNLGVRHLEAGRLEQAEASLRAALQADSGFAETHSNLGIIAYRQRNRSAALAHFREALTVNPYHVQAHVNLAILLAQSGDKAAARDHLDIALRLKADAPEVQTARDYVEGLLQRP